MSGFSPKWLALREPADHRARNAILRDAAAAQFAERETLTIVDLGCGTGSSLRALAGHLPAQQTWRLVDNDPSLVATARQTLIDWADTVERAEPLLLRKSGRNITVVFVEADLKNAADAIFEGVDLAAAAALFDLVSGNWIERLCAMLARRRLPLLAALTYDGFEQWSPHHEADAAMLDAFHQHQARDKGFGPALGPQAAPALLRALPAHGYEVASASSPWRLRAPRDASLIAALADGAAAAIMQTALLPAAAVEEWRRLRRLATNVEIGHVDLFARPK